MSRCDAETAFEIADFAADLRQHDGQVVVVEANPWVVGMLTIADVAGALTLPPLGSVITRPRLAAEVSVGRAAALRELVRALDFEGVTESWSRLRSGERTDDEGSRAPS